MPTTTVTDPIILDSTGQSILTAINNLTEAVQPTNVCVDISTSLPASGWSSSAPYIQTWMNNKVTDECAVKVEFPSDATGTGITYLEFEKVAGGVKFTAPSKPSVAIPVIVHIINAEAESVTSISGDMVSTNVVSGAANVDQALTAHNTAIANMGDVTYGIDFSKMTHLSSGTNLNNILTPGSYYSASTSETSSMTNCPVSSGFNLHVESVAGGTGQYILQTVKSANISNAVFIRSSDGSIFSSWLRMSNDIDARFGNLYSLDVEIVDNGANAPTRLSNQWTSFANALKTQSGKTSGYAQFVGTINFAEGTGISTLGVYYAHGIMNCGNNRATVFLTQYNSGDVYCLKVGNGTFSKYTMTMTSL